MQYPWPVEGVSRIKLNIAKPPFVGGDNTASGKFPSDLEDSRYPSRVIALSENGTCPKRGYRKP